MGTQQVTNPNKALWEKGDFTRIALHMRKSGETLVTQFGISKGLQVLDVGCGDGTTAIPMAKLGAEVLGVDIASNLVQAGNERVKKEGVANCRFQEGDATNLSGLADQTFDLVVSIFGVMFAPRPMDVAKELVRVTKPGGRIIMGNWIPDDPTMVAQMFRICSAYTPPPPEGFVSPMAWGIENHVTERFGQAGIPKENISFKRETFYLKANTSPAELVDVFLRYFGPAINAYEAAGKNGEADILKDELVALFNSRNQSGNQDTTSIPATFLLVTVMV